MNADLDGEDSRWLIVEDGFTAALANAYETLFTTGNGYLGTRGSLEEGHEGALPGTFLRGVFDHHDSAVPDLVKAPDWLILAVVVNGIRLDVTSVSVVRHRRILDMREGTLLRDTVFEDSQGRRTRLETAHFASSADQHLCCLQARITPENHTAPVSVHSGIDGTGYNLDRRPIYTEPPPDDPQMKWHKWAKSKHFNEVAREQLPEGIYLETRTIDTGITVGFAARTTVSPTVESSIEQQHKYIEQVSRTQVAAGDTITVEKLVAIYTSRDVAAGSVRPACLDELRRPATAGFTTCRERNRAAWQAKWADPARVQAGVHVLHDVFGGGQVPDHEHRQPHQPPVVLAEERGDGSRGPIRCGFRRHQASISHRFAHPVAGSGTEVCPMPIARTTDRSVARFCQSTVSCSVPCQLQYESMASVNSWTSSFRWPAAGNCWSWA
jgi:kojibiose phosphorylase